MNILIIGQGAREHAICLKIAQSPFCDEIYCAPGSDAIAKIAKIVPIAVHEVAKLAQFALENNINCVIPCPEVPFGLGIYDECQKLGVRCLGPSQSAAILETSKIRMKEIAQKYQIPTAKFAKFSNVAKALAYIESHDLPIVIKTDGLAAGKGVIIAQNINEAQEAITSMMIDKKFGEQGANIVIEEFMQGQELSYFVLCDGKNFVFMGAAQDHKRINDGDEGENTGGMGAYSPVPFLDIALDKKIQDKIVRPLVDGMAQESMAYMGILFFGLMVDKGEPKLIEINIRMGDPECQTILPMMHSDLLVGIQAAIDGVCDFFQFQFKNTHSICVVIAGKFYPQSPITGQEIILPQEIPQNIHVFHAGTKIRENKIIANGGRVLSIIATGDSLHEAQDSAYQFIKRINFPDSHYRKDIGWRALKN